MGCLLYGRIKLGDEKEFITKKKQKVKIVSKQLSEVILNTLSESESEEFTFGNNKY